MKKKELNIYLFRNQIFDTIVMTNLKLVVYSFLFFVSFAVIVNTDIARHIVPKNAQLFWFSFRYVFRRKRISGVVERMTADDDAFQNGVIERINY